MKILMSFSMLLILFAAFRIKIVEGNEYENQLVDFILKNCDRSRPVQNYSSVMNIYFNISLVQLLKVDEKHQTIATKLWRTMTWTDYSLKWNSEDYGNITEGANNNLFAPKAFLVRNRYEKIVDYLLASKCVVLTSVNVVTRAEGRVAHELKRLKQTLYKQKIAIERGRVWLPDIRLLNMVSYEEKQFENDVTNLVKNDGTVFEVLPMVIKSSCTMDVTWFPFDEQKCTLEFSSWSLPAKYLNLELVGNTADISSFVTNGEWNLLGVPVVKNIFTYKCCSNDSYLTIIFTIHLKRRSLYYFFNLLIPMGLIGFLAILGFTLSPDSGEKLTHGVTVLFSLIVFLNMIGNSMPANSDAIPLLGTYFNCIMFMIALSVVSTIVINLNLKAINIKEIDGCSRKLFLVWLPRFLRINSPAIADREVSLSINKVGSATPSDINRLGEKNFAANVQSASKQIAKQQWMFVAIVVDRACLIISFIVTLISVTIFLIYAFK